MACSSLNRCMRIHWDILTLSLVLSIPWYGISFQKICVSATLEMSSKTLLRNWKVSPSNIPEIRNHFIGSIQFWRLVCWSCLYLLWQGMSSTISHIIWGSYIVKFNTGTKKTKSSKWKPEWFLGNVDLCSLTVMTTSILMSTAVPRTV